MPGFLHGVEIVELDDGPRPIQMVRSSIIGLVGTAPKGPVNTPTLILGSRSEAVKQFGNAIGTIPDAFDAIFDHAGAMIVVINVLDPAIHKAAVVAAEYTFDATTDLLEVADEYIYTAVVKSQDLVTTYVEDTDYTYDSDTGKFTRLAAGAIAAGATVSIGYDRVDETLVTTADIIGGVDGSTGAYMGLQALLAAEGDVGVQPKILIAPGFTSEMAVVSDMIGVAERLRAVIVADGSNTNDTDALAYRANFGSERVYLVDPWVNVWDTIANAEAPQAVSARIAGLMVKNDDERGYYTSPSNREINGIVGTVRPIDFTLGDPNARANYLNENEIATIIQKDGYRLWGNRTCSSDPKWAFLAHVRLNDMIMESLLRAHMWAVDRNITKTYLEDVTEGVNAFLSKLTNEGAISGGQCWADPDLNTAISMDAGQVYFDFDYGRYGVAERITFRARVNNDYTVEAVFG